MENSELVAEALGEHVFDFFLRNKRTEWENYRSHVTPFELKTYLSLCASSLSLYKTRAVTAALTAALRIVDCVAKPATQRPKLPSVGRLGLVEASRVRGPGPAGLEHRRARRAVVVAVARGRCRRRAARRWSGSPMRTRTGLGRTQSGPGQGPRAARPAVRRARFVVGAGRSSGRLSRLVASARGRRHTAVGRQSCGRHSPSWPNASKSQGTPWLRWLRCASSTATGCWCWPPSTWRRPWRTNRCWRSPTVGAHLSDLADAALGAALTVATRFVGADGERPAAGDDRDGQVWRARTELRQRRRRHLRRRARRRHRDPVGRRADAVRQRHLLRGGRRAAAGGQTRPAGAHPGVSHRLLPAVGQDVGVPGADEGAARRR